MLKKILAFVFLFEYWLVMLRAAKTRAASEPSIETPSLERAEHVLFI